jgi:hypothetical protein
MAQAPLKNKPRYLFEDCPNIISAFSCRHDRNMSLAYGDTTYVLESRRNFLQTINIDYRNLVCAKQIHGSNIKSIKEPERARGAIRYENSISDTDAFITERRNVPLAIFTADCLSIFIYDSQAPAIGLVHAGWRSSKEEIVSKVVKLMQKEFNTLAGNLSVALGPCIRSCCYEVENSFNGLFPYGLISRNAHFYLDLAAINKRQLLDSGIREKNIFDSGICTSCKNKDFFSFRKEGKDCGRMMSVMMLK